MQRLQDLLAEALERPPAERGDFLQHACGEDLQLQVEIEELLALHEDAADYFSVLGSEIAAAGVMELEASTQAVIEITPYRTVTPIGRGGMGAVYLAERTDGAFDQQVALKLMHQDMDTPQMRARFLAERQLLARLSHPNIAHLLDGGVTDEGRPYFVMEHVKGVAITRYCADNRLSIEKVLRLFIVIINAVSYLHRNLVVHRDLKPSNIFVDQDGQVKLLDFGIAKLLSNNPDENGPTQTGERFLTPHYAAPEQIFGKPITTATDVYALGVVLYELLTGQLPHHLGSTEHEKYVSTLPPPPSSVVRSHNKDRSASSLPVSWNRIDPDLDTICLTALRPEPEGRYSSAEQLGQDIERYLLGLPVHAVQSTFSYRVGKFVQRHRSGVLITTTLVVLMTFGFLRERDLRNDAEQAHSEAQQQATRAVTVSNFLSQLLSSVNPEQAQGKEITVAEILDQAAERLQGNAELKEQPVVELALRRTIGHTYLSLGRFLPAKTHLERALELHGGLSADEPKSIYVAAQLGLVHLRLGEFDQAETYLQNVLDLRIETLGEEHPLSLTAMNHLADLRWSQGRYDEVEAIDRRTLEIRRNVLGEDHPDTLKSLNGLAATYFNSGRYSEAAPLFEKALAVYRRKMGENHPHTLTLANNLASAHSELGHFGEAEELLRGVVTAQSQVLGNDHPETVRSVQNLGVALAQLARYEEAETYLRKAVAIRCTFSGDEKGCLYAKGLLADLFRERGRFEQAGALLISTLERQKELFGPEDEDTLKTMAGLARPAATGAQPG